AAFAARRRFHLFQRGILRRAAMIPTTSSVPEPNDEPRWWVTPWTFAVHAVVGSLIFAVIASPAVALDLIVRALESQAVNGVILWGLRAAEYANFAADLLLYLVFIWRTTMRTLKKL